MDPTATAKPICSTDSLRLPRIRMTSGLSTPIVLRVDVVESPLLQTWRPATNSSVSHILKLPLQGNARYIDGIFLIAKAAISRNPVFKDLTRLPLSPSYALFMGLDAVEIVLRTEDLFDTTIEDDESAAVFLSEFPCHASRDGIDGQTPKRKGRQSAAPSLHIIEPQS
jgi:hypothetical protein